MSGNEMENYKWEDFLKETEEIAKNLPKEMRDRMVKIAGWAYEPEYSLEDDNKFKDNLKYWAENIDTGELTTANSLKELNDKLIED